MAKTNTDRKVVKLIMVSDQNNNKFYIMTKINDSEWEAQWGRVQGDLNNINQGSGQRKRYSMYEWDKTYRSKTGKGYEDVTHLYEEIEQPTGPVTTVKPVDPVSVISNALVRQLMYDLLNYANVSVKTNYTVSSDNVTQLMVDEAQSQLNKITPLIKMNGNISLINESLLKLYKIIPRKMSNVKDYLLTSLSSKSDLDRAQKMIANEQDTLDVMAGQVKLKAQQKELNTKPDDVEVKTQVISILDQMGLMIEPASQKEIDEIKKYAAHNSSKIKKVFKVINKKTENRYEDHKNKLSTSHEELYWHGSRNQNWFNILQTGLLIRPSGAIHTGSMFGDSLYFANKAEKSINYSSLRGSYWTGGSDNKGYLALFKVNVGRQKHIYKHDSSCYSLTQQKIEKEGFDSVYAHGGADLRNDEFMVYMSEKCTIAYLIELG